MPRGLTTTKKIKPQKHEERGMWEERERFLMKGGEYTKKNFKGSYLLMSIVVIGLQPAGQTIINDCFIYKKEKKMLFSAASLSLIEFVILYIFFIQIVNCTMWFFGLKQQESSLPS